MKKIQHINHAHGGAHHMKDATRPTDGEPTFLQKLISLRTSAIDTCVGVKERLVRVRVTVSFFYCA